MNKKTSLIIGTLVILISVGIVLAQRSSKLKVTTPVTPNPSVTAYTLADVRTHKTKTNCWTTINGEVYDVTSWISKHPGGAEAIISLCGIDGSTLFNGQHGGQPRPASELAGYKIGILK